MKKDRPVRGSENKKESTWVISIKEPVFDELQFLSISDVTGESLYIQSKQLAREIAKDENGKYFRTGH